MRCHFDGFVFPCLDQPVDIRIDVSFFHRVDIYGHRACYEVSPVGNILRIHKNIRRNFSFFGDPDFGCPRIFRFALRIITDPADIKRYRANITAAVKVGIIRVIQIVHCIVCFCMAMLDIFIGYDTEFNRFSQNILRRKRVLQVRLFVQINIVNTVRDSIFIIICFSVFDRQCTVRIFDSVCFYRPARCDFFNLIHVLLYKVRDIGCLSGSGSVNLNGNIRFIACEFLMLNYIAVIITPFVSLDMKGICPVGNKLRYKTCRLSRRMGQFSAQPVTVGCRDRV